MKLKIVILAFCLFFVGSTAFSGTTYYIPQIAVGPFSMNDTNFSYRSSFIFFNNTSAASDVTLKLYNSDHSEMIVTMTGYESTPVEGSSFTFTLPVGGARILQASSDGLAAGPADVIASSEFGVGVMARYTIYNDDTDGTFVTEVGVKALADASTANDFVIPVQETDDGAVLTGVALYNPYSWDTSMDITLKNQFGVSIGSDVITLTSGTHTAFYVNQYFPDISGTNFYGTLKVQSDGPLAAMTLRQNAPSFLTYTSCPLVPTASSQTTFRLAQFVDGEIGGSKYKTTLMLQNFRRSKVTVNFAATGGADGASINLGWISSTGDYFTNTIDLAAGETRFLTSNGSANAQGGIVITSTAPIGAAALFLMTDLDDNFMTEVGVQDSPLLNRLTMPVDSRYGSDNGWLYGTGLALYNPTTSPVTLKPVWLDGTGLVLTTGTITIQPKAQTVQFFEQIFPSMGTVAGSLAFQATTTTSGVSAMALGANMDPFSMTSFTAVTGTASGFAITNGTPRFTYMNITEAMTGVNKILPAAPTLTVNAGAGWNGATYVYKDVIAQSSGRVYKPKTDNGSAFYVPAGYYTIRASGWVGALGQWNGIWANYVSAPTYFGGVGTVTVNASTSTRTVTGSISGWDALKSTLGITTSASLSFYGTNATDSRYTFVVYCNTDSSGTGTFTQTFPDATYTAAILRTTAVPTTGTWTTTGLQNLLAGSSFTVDSANTTATLTAPYINTLSGTANFTGGTPPQGAFTIKARDNSLPDFGYINPLPGSYQSGAAITMNNPYYPGLSYFPRDTAWVQNPFGGSYSELIGAGSNYKMSYSFIVYNTASATTGIATYAPASGAAVLIDSDKTYDFGTLPALPGLVTVSGNISGNRQGIASVIARSDEIFDADGNVIPGLSYYASVNANASGDYTITVLPGQNYQLYYNTGAMQIYQ